jgi:hypothetical protein
VYGVTWCGVLMLIAVFAWLNLEWSRETYVRHDEDRWRGGVRLGFPMCCWDAGRETKVVGTEEGLEFQVGEYGGLRWPGLANNLVVFALCLAGGIFFLERLRRALARRRGLAQLPPAPEVVIETQPVSGGK